MRHVIKVCGCTEIVSVSGSPRCWLTCGRAVALVAGARNSEFRTSGQRKATTWHSKLVTAGVAEDT